MSSPPDGYPAIDLAESPQTLPVKYKQPRKNVMLTRLSNDDDAIKAVRPYTGYFGEDPDVLHNDLNKTIQTVGKIIDRCHNRPNDPSFWSRKNPTHNEWNSVIASILSNAIDPEDDDGVPTTVPPGSPPILDEHITQVQVCLSRLAHTPPDVLSLAIDAKHVLSGVTTNRWSLPWYAATHNLGHWYPNPNTQQKAKKPVSFALPQSAARRTRAVAGAKVSYASKAKTTPANSPSPAPAPPPTAATVTPNEPSQQAHPSASSATNPINVDSPATSSPNTTTNTSTPMEVDAPLKPPQPLLQPPLLQPPPTPPLLPTPNEPPPPLRGQHSPSVSCSRSPSRSPATNPPMTQQ